MIEGIGASILEFTAGHEGMLTISRSVHLCEDRAAHDVNGGRFITRPFGTIRHLGMVEQNEITGKRVRDTIRVRSARPLYAAVPQENAEEDIIDYDGSKWRVISVTRLSSTWRGIAVRTSGKKGFCNDDPKPSSDENSIHII